MQVLIIHGERDALVPKWNSQKLAALLGADFEVYQDCGHMPMEEMPDRFISTVGNFVARCERQ
jgi:pimeloyl-ACP methyl ester carboxylesterase